MSKVDEIFAAANEDEKKEDVLETLALSIQIALQKSMHANCVSQKELASRLGLTPARVSQMLSGGSSNLTLKSIANIAYALGEDFEFLRKSEADKLFTRPRITAFNDAIEVPKKPRSLHWRQVTTNSNSGPSVLVA